MAKKFYAVKKGQTPGIYRSWDECKKQVHGYPGASYKSFLTEEEAKVFINGNENKKVSNESEKCIAYVDGSYEHSVKLFSYGVVLFYKGKEERFYKAFENEELVSMRNVAGEIMGAQKAMKYCVEHGIEARDIFYDYEGIEKWCTGEWKTNKEGTKAYKAFYESIKSQLCVTFHKVAAHTGDLYNEEADQLAKKAIKERVNGEV